MTRFILAAAVAGLMGLPAFASPDSDARLDEARKAEIITRLSELGYDVRRIEADDGMIEVYVLKDGQRLELYLDADLTIVRTEADD